MKNETSIHFRAMATRNFKIKHKNVIYKFWCGITDDVVVYSNRVELSSFGSTAIMSKKTFASCLSKGLLKIITV
jgi:hypothetical protein